jgi:rhodanese-related sulfurtransferase
MWFNIDDDIEDYGMRPAIRISVVLFMALLLAGFRWSLMFGELNWDVINRAIQAEYPDVPEISTDELYGLLRNKSALHLVDVREPAEYSVSHLPGAVQVADFVPEKISRETMIVAYCSVGLRSAKYAQQLRRRGFTGVYNLRGSIFVWADRGFPLVVDGRKALHVHPYSERWGKLLDKELQSYHPLE